MATFTVYVQFRGSVQEIDVKADSKYAAEAEAIKILKRDCTPGGRIVHVEERHGSFFRDLGEHNGYPPRTIASTALQLEGEVMIIDHDFEDVPTEKLLPDTPATTKCPRCESTEFGRVSDDAGSHLFCIRCESARHRLTDDLHMTIVHYGSDDAAGAIGTGTHTMPPRPEAGGVVHIPSEVADVLRHYVYALRDPRDGHVFYVGKGIGNRINSHVREAGKDLASENAKLRAINEIEASDMDVDLLFLRTGIEDADTAFAIEQAVIDAFAADNHPLTNLVRGHDSGGHGLATLNVVIARYRADPCPPIPEPVIMVKIQAGWRSDMNDTQVFQQTRGHWKIAPWVRDRAKYCLGVAYGVVRGVYRIDSWYPSEEPWDVGQNRWGFRGEPAADWQHVIGTHVRDVFGGRVMYRRFIDGYPGSPD